MRSTIKRLSVSASLMGGDRAGTSRAASRDVAESGSHCETPGLFTSRQDSTLRGTPNRATLNQVFGSARVLGSDLAARVVRFADTRHTRSMSSYVSASRELTRWLQTDLSLLRVLVDEFLAAGRFEVVSATATVKPQVERRARRSKLWCAACRTVAPRIRDHEPASRRSLTSSQSAADVVTVLR
jgi:hypothetical protein